jgi:hypothetical protein
MTSEAAHPGGDPRWLLSQASALTRRVRREQRATWFPLLVFAVLTFGSIPVRRYAGHYLTCRATLSGQTCVAYSNADLLYWPTAIVVAYVAIMAFYIRRTRARGVETRVRPYAVAGIIIAVVLSSAAFWEYHYPQPSQVVFGVSGLSYRLAGPGTAIGLALLVLGWAERSFALLVVTVTYLAVALVPITFGWTSFDPPWYSTPAISQGTVLMLTGIGFALTQRPLRSSAP